MLKNLNIHYYYYYEFIQNKKIDTIFLIIYINFEFSIIYIKDGATILFNGLTMKYLKTGNIYGKPPFSWQ